MLYGLKYRMKNTNHTYQWDMWVGIAAWNNLNKVYRHMSSFTNLDAYIEVIPPNQKHTRMD